MFFPINPDWKRQVWNMEIEMKKDKMVVLEFLASHEDDSNVSFEFGPCTEEEGEALCRLLSTKYSKNIKGLIKKLSGIMNFDTLSHVKWATNGFYAQVVPAFSYDLDILQVTQLLGS